MRLIGVPLLLDFGQEFPDATKDLDAWRLEVQAAAWGTPHDIKARYPKASMVGNRNVIFNIRHNLYRLHVTVDYSTQTVVVRRIGTHEEYDRWTFD
jgi:mRNA interferase HigB